MSNLPDFNFPAFHDAQARLEAVGYAVGQPAQGLVEGYMYEDYLRRALGVLLGCSAVAVLPGWESSRGAKLEVAVAETLAMPIYPLDEWCDRASQILAGTAMYL